ncbi:MAG: pyruvate kinase, partial [Asgard group archaeon]|nr:pyruvate kinase [Asgard group archaeon]
MLSIDDNNSKPLSIDSELCEIRSKKGINIPNVKLDVPCLTQKDLKDLE